MKLLPPDFTFRCFNTAALNSEECWQSSQQKMLWHAVFSVVLFLHVKSVCDGKEGTMESEVH